jgi:two-component sensor histidine kinase
VIHVSLRRLQSRIRLTVEDNGIGLPAGGIPDNSDSPGIGIVKALTGQLGGTLEISSEGGSRFVMTFEPGNACS